MVCIVKALSRSGPEIESGFHQIFGVILLRAVEYGGGWAAFDDATVFHDKNVMRHGPHNAQIVADEQIAKIVFFL